MPAIDMAAADALDVLNKRADMTLRPLFGPYLGLLLWRNCTGLQGLKEQAQEELMSPLDALPFYVATSGGIVPLILFIYAQGLGKSVTRSGRHFADPLLAASPPLRLLALFAGDSPTARRLLMPPRSEIKFAQSGRTSSRLHQPSDIGNIMPLLARLGEDRHLEATGKHNSDPSVTARSEIKFAPSAHTSSLWLFYHFYWLYGSPRHLLSFTLFEC
jgi:hypothetical protein